ncbi:MAG: hypothetical protein NUV52_00185 [Candidatus Roizmanbacteria bacterium]|nr:hypothetical protein [Candidatus Roizmanbacteria bacterium]
MLLVLAIAAGLGAVYWYQTQTIPSKTVTATPSKPPTTPSPTLFTVNDPPTESISGNLDTFLGDVTWEPREATHSSPISSRAVIRQGDYIETGDDGTASITFPIIGTLSMEPNTQVQIVQTLPANAVLLHRTGTAVYERTGETPITVRALSLLVDLEEESIVRITVDEEEGSVLVLAEQGNSVAAYNDADFETVKLMLEEGQELTYDSLLRESDLQ